MMTSEALRTYRREYYRKYRKLHAERISSINRKYSQTHRLNYLLGHIRSRCNNPNHKSYLYYGAQGIRCFLNVADLSYLWQRDSASTLERPSIDRIDPFGHYSRENCRFIELRENSARQIRKIKRAKPGVLLEGQRMGQDILKFQEAANLLRIHPMTLYSLVRKRKVPAMKLGGQWRFHRALLLQWVSDQSYETKLPTPTV